MIKQIVPIMLAVAFISGTIGVGLVQAEGSASANVTNSVPVVENQEVVNGAWVVVTTVVPMVAFYYNVSVSDGDTAADIVNTTIQLKYYTADDSNNPSTTYEFFYNETLTLFAQVRPDPTGDIYLNSVARDTNGIFRWHIDTTVEDVLGTKSNSGDHNFIMGPYVEMTYWGNAGNMDFNWTGQTETNQSATFNTLVTCNDVFELNASYTGDFGPSWPNPEFWIKPLAGASTQLPDAGASPGTNNTWFTSGGPSSFLQNNTHILSLVFPPGVPKGTYTGVTIWIQAKNE
jgi:hypothetical protein